MPLNDSNETYGNDESSVADLLNGVGVQGVLVVGTTSVEIKVGGSKLAERKLVTLYNNSDSILYWGFTSGVTVLTGSPIQKKQSISWTIGDNLSLYIIAGTAGNNTRITEAS